MGAALVAVVVLVAIFTIRFALARPPTLDAQASSAGPVINLETANSVATALEHPRADDPHPDWVGYLPTTVIHVPANATVTVVIHQEGGPIGLRNPIWSRAQGVVGGGFHLTYFRDDGSSAAGDFSSIDPATAGHTFAIPDLGVFVPLPGVNPHAPAGAFNVVTFRFRTGAAGTFRWQCFVPCGSGPYGNGGAMQTLGYMAGYMVVD